MELPIPFPARRASLEEYFRLADESPTKLEYMAGEHIQITTNLGSGLHQHMKGTANQVLNSDSRTKCASDRYCYPDISIIRGEPQFDPLNKLTITNPTVIFEVLSPSTELADRSEKFFRYIQLPSLKAYYLVAADKPRVESFVRAASGAFEVGPVAEGIESVLRIPAVGIELPLRDIYDRVKFAAVG